MDTTLHREGASTCELLGLLQVASQQLVEQLAVSATAVEHHVKLTSQALIPVSSDGQPTAENIAVWIQMLTNC